MARPTSLLFLVAHALRRPARLAGAVALLIALGAPLPARAETIPPAPARHFNDYARVVTGGTAARLDRALADFERATSNQILVAIYPKMDSSSSVFDYTQRVAQSWHVGQKDRNNGAVLFLFIAEHEARIQVGYGLEGALPDALAKRIIDDEMIPHLRAGDFDGGLTAAVNAMLAATRGEYQPAAHTTATNARRGSRHSSTGGTVFAMILIVAAALARSRFQRRMVFGPRGRIRRGGMWWMGPGPGSGGGWGGGSGFGGGGGSFGGGGAGGRW